jgi:hypothetical protein
MNLTVEKDARLIPGRERRRGKRATKKAPPFSGKRGKGLGKRKVTYVPARHDRVIEYTANSGGSHS